MGDLIFILVTLVFFGLSILFGYGCKWVIKDGSPTATDYVQIKRESEEGQIA
jgi:hypothetical protein